MKQVTKPTEKPTQIQEYINILWHGTDEEPVIKPGEYEVAILHINKEHYVNTEIFYSDYNWKDFVRQSKIVKWTYCDQVIPTLPVLDDYTTIRTYEDACFALGERIEEGKLKENGVPNHIIALMKLELVCKALWGGEVKVYPDPQGSRTYYYPWFSLYTQSEIQEMSEERRGLLLSANAGNGANAGWGYAPKTYRSSYSSARRGFRLCLDTYEKAEYFGTQFLELWAEYLAFNFTVGERLK